MLAGSNGHILCGCHVGNRRLARIDIGNPQRDREFVDGAAKGDGQCARESQEQSREPILVGWQGDFVSQTAAYSESIAYCRLPFQGRAFGTWPKRLRRRSKCGWGPGMFAGGRNGPGGQQGITI